jgi:hypothetical protein
MNNSIRPVRGRDLCTVLCDSTKESGLIECFRNCVQLDAESSRDLDIAYSIIATSLLLVKDERTHDVAFFVPKLLKRLRL